MLPCYNRGCGQEYDPQKNKEDACRHHPGEPFFHDAYKGWSCCNKKSVDFTEFLSIKGCTLSKHSNIKPPEPEKPTKTENKNEVIEVRAPIKESMERPPVDTSMTEIKPTVAPALKDLIDNLVVKAPSATNSLNIGEIAIGTLCKNSGCSYSYSGTDADNGECQYHNGVPIFHEGMKYWSCCQRKTSDFTVFMAQKGCVYGQHKFIKEDDKRVVKCRYDWHQTAKDVIVSIYAKKYHYAQSKIEVNPVRLHCVLVFPDQENATFEIDLELRGIINVGDVKAHMHGTKVEITMPKAEPGSWPKLDFPREKLPPPVKEGQDPTRPKTVSVNESDDDGFNLDDIETIKAGVHLTELASTKNDLD